ncbi:hypothetical protein LOK49_LG04G02392 [Camellia lanceoleosa]|uniref:Uncharacterized protein n=1 Tax=Camellia lanceoleosa TaxID=1840588 RepID=A0ACC0HU77_9ERIC|nr:hypothetical protein LOK49_LG04G02392 [Camellia lanceoleosa]
MPPPSGLLGSPPPTCWVKIYFRSDTDSVGGLSFGFLLFLFLVWFCFGIHRCIVWLTHSVNVFL